MYTYTWYQWLTFFYLYCFFGWIFESTYVSLKQKRFVHGVSALGLCGGKGAGKGLIGHADAGAQGDVCTGCAGAHHLRDVNRFLFLL